MLDVLTGIDESLFVFLHHLFRGPAVDSVMWWISNTYVWIPLYILLAWWVIRTFGWRRGLIFIIAIALAVAMADSVCARLIRPAVERMRPANPANPLSAIVCVVNDYRGGPFGFPSCHAANTVTLATFFFLLTRNVWMRTGLAVWVAVNCVSRIYLGVHYPGDILFGAVVGMLSAFLWYYIARFFKSRFDNKC